MQQRVALVRVRKKRLSTAVKMMIGTTGLRLLTTILGEILETAYISTTIAMPSASPKGREATNSTTMYSTAAMIFVRSSYG